MNKRKLHHLWTRFRLVKPWYFLVLAVLSGVVCVFALRANNQHMIDLREAVYAADKNNTDVQKPLKELQSFVTSHMNTNLSAGKTPVYPPIQLKYTYERLVQAQKEAYANANSSVYSEAQRVCEQQNSTDVSGRNRIPCIEQYVTSRTTTKPAVVPDALYKFSFASPRWSPDLAGLSMLVAVFSATAFVATLIAQLWLRNFTK